MKPIVVNVSPAGLYWQARWTDPATGRRIRRNVGRVDAMTKYDAEVEAARIQLELANPEYVQPGTAPKLSAWRDKMLADLAESRSDNTHASYSLVFDHLIRRFGDVRMDKVTPAMARQWRKSLDSGDFSGYTTSTYLSRARRIWESARREGFVGSNPFRGVASEKTREATEHEYVTVTHLDAMIERCPSPAYTLTLALARLAGLRAFEIAELKWEDIDFKMGSISLYSGVETTKRRSRIVPMCEKLRTILEAQTDRTGLVITETIDRRILKTIAEAAGVPDYGRPLQTLRANREQDWLSDRHEWTQVARWMGHHPTVAYKHYLKSKASSHTDDFARASGRTATADEKKSDDSVIKGVPS